MSLVLKQRICLINRTEKPSIGLVKKIIKKKKEKKERLAIILKGSKIV